RSLGHRFASEHNRLLGRFERRAPPLPLLGLGNTGRVLASVRYRLSLTHLPVDAVRDLVFGPTPGLLDIFESPRRRCSTGDLRFDRLTHVLPVRHPRPVDPAQTVTNLESGQPD